MPPGTDKTVRRFKERGRSNASIYEAQLGFLPCPFLCYRGSKRNILMGTRSKREFHIESHPYTGLVLYEVSLDDLDRLETETLSVGQDVSFCLAALAIALSFTATLATVSIPAGKLFDAFFIITLLGYAGTVYFGLRWYKGRRSFKNIVRRIKERPGSLGEEGNELDSEELENLPLSEKAAS